MASLIMIKYHFIINLRKIGFFIDLRHIGRHVDMYFLKNLKYLKIISKQTENDFTSPPHVNKLKLANLMNL